jgi:hypothetical protein
MVIFRVFLISCWLVSVVSGQANYDPVTYVGQDRSWEFHDAAGTEDTSSVWKEDNSIVAWATGYQDLQYGSNVDVIWQTPTKALGEAVGDSYDIVCLGRGGQITMTFANPIINGDSFDFAVFENSFDDDFLELAWVEVSTDGEHFVRFPNFSYTEAAVGGFGAVAPTNIHGFASKYKQGYGTPFDLEQLQLAYASALEGSDSFSDAYRTLLIDNFPFLDLNEINYIRVIDIVGDGSALDCEGIVIYDPYPTVGSSGFDLEAIAVIHQDVSDGEVQSINFDAISHQLYADGSLQLVATATSGLPVEFEILEGPASLEGTTLSFNGLGTVIVSANQSGDATYAAAASVVHSFVVADELQHLYFEPIANQVVGATNVQFYVSSSSGLPVSLFVNSGPDDANVEELTHLFSSGVDEGVVEIRASQSGGALDGVTYAPANDVFYTFEIVAVDASDAPIAFTDWQIDYGLTEGESDDTDGDGSSDFEEYVVGTDPHDAADFPCFAFEAVDDGFILELNVSSLSIARVRVLRAEELSSTAEWSEITPEIISWNPVEGSDPPQNTLQLKVLKNGEQSFWKYDLSSE